ncbi:MAG: VOC family protein [Candidatus Hydrogenedentes bacterium]|nr:VOC family protein [Candidatus Hydrogenedentota bacterium]
MVTRRGFLKTTGAALLGALVGAIVASTVGESLRSAAAAQEGVLKLESFDHIGFVVKDRDAVIELWSSLFGLGPWRTVEPAQGAMAKMAWVKVGSTQFELLEPRMEVKSHWSDHLEKHGDGIHHICVLSDTVEADVERLVAVEGAEVVVASPGFAYVKTAGHGDFILEVLHTRSSALNSY